MDFEEWFESLALDNWTNKKYMHDAFEAGQKSKQEDIEKAVLSLRNEFSLWADNTEQFYAIEAQIEQLEELLK